MNLYDKMKLENKIEKILDDNIKEVPYEGPHVSIQGIIDGVVSLIIEELDANKIHPATGDGDEIDNYFLCGKCGATLSEACKCGE